MPTMVRRVFSVGTSNYPAHAVSSFLYESLSLKESRVTRGQPLTPEQLRRTGLIPYTALRTVLKATRAHCAAPLTVRVQFGPFYSRWGTGLVVKTGESNPWSRATKPASS